MEPGIIEIIFWIVDASLRYSMNDVYTE